MPEPETNLIEQEPEPSSASTSNVALATGVAAKGSIKPDDDDKTYHQKYYITHKARYAENGKNWHKNKMTPATKEKRQASTKAWIKDHKERMYECKVCYEAKNPGRHKKWRERNPKKSKAGWREGKHRRRARIANSPIDHETMAFAAIINMIETYRCPYCTNLFNGIPTEDHVLPLNRGGQHKSGNLTIACMSCNSSKRDKTPEEFMAWKKRRAEILEKNGIKLEKNSNKLTRAA